MGSARPPFVERVQEAKFAMKIQVSIVDFFTPLATLTRSLYSLDRAARAAKDVFPKITVSLDLIDNSPGGAQRDQLLSLVSEWCPSDIRPVNVLSGHGNVGYGGGHNLSVLASDADVHLIANPDIDISEACLASGLAYFADHPEAGLLTPKIIDSEGGIERRIYRYPSVFDLLLRGFAPRAIREIFKGHLNRYTFAEVDINKPFREASIVTGCFMMFRGPLLRELSGFDESFFLYFEDFDLSLRAKAKSEIHYCPSMSTLHFGGKASRKGWRHIWLFGASAARFFNKHGWKLV
jgi:GT2 family glycosyltransferase